MQRRLETGRVPNGVLDQEHAGGPDDLDQRFAQVVFCVRVAYRVDNDAQRVESGLGGFHRLLDDGLADRQVEWHGADQRAVEVPADGRPRRGIADDQRLGIGLLSLGEGARRVQPVDVDLGAERHRERNRVHPNPFGAQQARFADRVAEVLAAIADDDDVTPAVVRKDRSAELQRGREVGVMRVRLALELAKLWVLADIDLYLGVAAEAEHAGAVIARSLLQDAADGDGFAVQRALHAGRQIGNHE